MDICKPILKVLRLADREGATMGLIYECMRQMIEEINNIKDVDHVMLDDGQCIDGCMLHSPLHATGFILHPIWRDRIQEIDDKVNTSWLDTIMRYANGDEQLQGALLDEFYAYRTREMSTFGIPMANDPIRMKRQLSGGKCLEHALLTYEGLPFVCFLKELVHLLVKEIGVHFP